jgi:hypothetical protein
MELSSAAVLFSEKLQDLLEISATVRLNAFHQSKLNAPLKVKSAFALVGSSSEEKR